jgi:hypothetical protein
MLRRLATCAAALTAIALARPAAADGLYFFEGVGASEYSDEVADYIGDSGINIHGGLGWRSGHIALEVYARAEIPVLTAHALDGAYGGSTTNPYPYPALSTDGLAIVGLDLKVIQPVSKHWSAYARAGLSKMIADDEYSGRGVGATAGIQVAGKVPALGFLFSPMFFTNIGPKVHAAAWFEANTSFHRLHGDGPSIDARIQGWTVGFSVGQDF